MFCGDKATASTALKTQSAKRFRLLLNHFTPGSQLLLFVVSALKFESVAENEQEESDCRFFPTMKQPGIGGTNFRSGLNIGFLVDPVEKAFNRLAEFTD
jgi:hypothetical protein